MMDAVKQRTIGPQPTTRLHYGFVVLAFIILAIFAALGLGRHGYASILPAMQDSLKLTNTETGELQSWNLLGYLLTVVFAGLLATRFGPRLVISFFLLIAASGMALTGLVPTFEGARWGRFLAGVGGAGANVPAMALVSAWFGSRCRGLAAGAAVAGSSFGLMVTGPLIPAILHGYGPEGWRFCWYALSAMTVGSFALCAIFLRNRPQDHGLCPLGEAVAQTGQPNGGPQLRSKFEKQVEPSGKTSEQSPSPIGWERAGVRVHEEGAGLNWSHVWRSRLLWHLAAIYFAFGFSYVIYATFFVRYLVKEWHFTQASAGMLWMQVGVVSAISGFIWGSLSDRWGRRTALLLVFTLQGLSYLCFGAGHALPFIYLSAGLFAITAWSIPALMAALAGDIFGARLAPAALGLMTIVFGTAQALGPFFAGRLADATHSFSLAFVTAGVVALLGAAGSLSLRQN